MIYQPDLHEFWKSADRWPKGKMQWDPSFKGSVFFENYFLIDNRLNHHIPVYILPDICGHIIIHEFNVLEQTKIQIKLIGPRTTGFLIDRKNRKRTFILRLKPNAIYRLFGIPSDEFVNCSVFLNDILETKVPELEDVLFLVNIGAHPSALFSEIENVLIKQINDFFPRQLQPFINLCSKNLESKNVKTAAAEIGISERYLRKICHQHIGVAPNKIFRIQRFTDSLKKRLQFPNYTWSDVAHLSGYVDHSHLIAEYQQLMGCTPVQMFS